MKNKKIIKIISTLLAFSTLISVGGVANASVANKKTKDYYNQIIKSIFS